MAGRVIRTVAVRVRADVTDFQKSMKQMEKALTNTANQMKRIGSTMTTFITAPVALAGVAVSKMAMDYTASLKQVENNLGASATAVKRWASDNALAFNMAKSDATKYAAVYSNLLSGFLDENQNADFTQQLLQQSAVVANKTSRSIEDVMGRIRSGLLGNTEAIEDLGINVNVAMLESTEAFKKFAGNQSWNKLSFQTQQQIRLFAILEQSVKKYGTTLDNSASSKMQRSIARIKDLALEMGERLLPKVEKLIEMGNKMLDWLDNLDPKVQDTIMVMVGLAAAMGPVLVVAGSTITAIGSLGTVIGALSNPVGITIAAVVALTGALVALYNTNEQFREKVNYTWDNIQEHQAKIANKLENLWNNHSSTVGGIWDRLVNGIVGKLDVLLSRIDLVLGGISKIGSSSWFSGLGEISVGLQGSKESVNSVLKLRDMVEKQATSRNSASTWGGYAAAQYDKASKSTSKPISDMINGFKAVGNTATKTYDKMNDSIKSFIQSIKDQTRAYMDFVGLFDKANNSSVLSIDRVINRFKGQLRAMQTYQESVAILQSKSTQGIISQGLFEAFKSQGVGAAAQLKALAGASNTQLSELSSLYGSRLGISKEMAYGDVMGNMKKEKATNQIVFDFSGANIFADDNIVTTKMADAIMNKLRAAGYEL
jgi:hypothetical protein